MKKDLLELYLDELKAYLAELGEPSYRADQIYGWLHHSLAGSFSEMTNISKKLRDRLEETAGITQVRIVDRLISGIDGTRKYILGFEDGTVIEAVMMRYEHGNSVCVSSQAGCRMGCAFCASTIDGLARNLTAAEILSEVYTIERDTKERVSNIVIMGSGEPLDNFDEVVRFIRLVSSPEGRNISLRNITLSTCGIVPGILKLAELKLPITLAISLHACSQEEREQIMPAAKAYPFSVLFPAIDEYYHKTGRRISYEYSLLSGVNDTPEHAARLAKLLRGKHAHVNLIPVNPVKERSFRAPERQNVDRFRELLTEYGINATVRREMGRDINSACGQLRRSYLNHDNSCSTQ